MLSRTIQSYVLFSSCWWQTIRRVQKEIMHVVSLSYNRRFGKRSVSWYLSDWYFCRYRILRSSLRIMFIHDDVIKWKHFPRYWPFVRRIHRSPVNSPHKGQWREALIFSLICVWINGWVNNREAGDLRRYHTHYDITVMYLTRVAVNQLQWYLQIWTRRQSYKGTFA